MALTDAAIEAGADTVLTGLGADELLGTAPFYIADLIKRGRVCAASRETVRWAQAHRCSLWRFLWPFGLAPLLPAWMHAGPAALLHGGYASWQHQNHLTLAPWVLPEFARRERVWERALNHVRRNYRSAPSVVQSEALARLRLTSGDWARCTLAAPHGLVVAHPFRDLRVLAFGLGARQRVPPVPGQQKRLLAQALRDVLPQSIRQRRSKGHYNAVYFSGLSRNARYLEDMVRQARVEELGLFDTECLLQCLHQAAMGLATIDGVVGLNNSLAIIKWHSMLPEWLNRPLPPAHTIHSAGSAQSGDQGQKMAEREPYASVFAR